MSDHAIHAEESAERAGGYLQSAEAEITADFPDRANAYAQMATASATLSIAQRIADLTEKAWICQTPEQHDG